MRFQEWHIYMRINVSSYLTNIIRCSSKTFQWQFSFVASLIYQTNFFQNPWTPSNSTFELVRVDVFIANRVTLKLRLVLQCVIYEIPWSTSGIWDQGLKYMNWIRKYNEWNHNIMPKLWGLYFGLQCCVIYEIPWSRSGIWDQGLKYMNWIRKHIVWNHNTWPAGECIIVLWGIWKLYYENSFCGEWDMNHISLSTHRFR